MRVNNSKKCLCLSPADFRKLLCRYRYYSKQYTTMAGQSHGLLARVEVGVPVDNRFFIKAFKFLLRSLGVSPNRFFDLGTLAYDLSDDAGL